MKTHKIAGFTLIELMIVVVVIGVLVSIAWPRYILVTEKSRTAEAKNVFGLIRAAESSYLLEYDTFTTNMSFMSLNLPTACNASYYYNYSITGGGSSYTATATRCTSGGKSPDSPGGINYELNMTNDGTLGGTAPYV